MQAIVPAMKKLFSFVIPPALAALLCAPAQSQTPAPAPTASASATPTPTPFPLSVSSTSHPDAIVRDWSDGEASFVAYAPPGGLKSGARLQVEGGALKLVNAHPSSFAVDCKIPAFDALKHGTLWFDYKIGPGVKVNLFLRVKGTYHGITFCGPDRVRAGSRKIGVVPGVRVDNKWHRAVVPVREWLQKLYPADATLPVDEVVMGNWDNTNYLVAGFGGNPTGATYWLDNFALTGSRSPSGEAAFDLKSDVPNAALSYVLNDGKPKPLRTEPAAKGQPLQTKLSLKPGEGLHLLHVYARTPATAGKPSRVWKRTWPFQISTLPPKLSAPSLKANVVEVPVQTSAPLDLASLKVSLGGQSFDAKSPHWSLDVARTVASGEKAVGENSVWGTAILKIAAGAAGLKLADGQKAEVEVVGKDSLGREIAGGKTALEVAYGQQDVAPPLPTVQFVQSGPTWVHDGTFESSSGGWVSEGAGGALIDRDSSTAAGGKWSLRFTAPANATPFQAALLRGSANVAQFPIVSFDYKIPRDLRLDFILVFKGTTYRIGFTDKGALTHPLIGSVPNVMADNKWHSAEINLAAMLRAVQPLASDLTVEYFSLADTDWLGNARGTQFWLDNFRFVPIERAPLQAQVLLADVSGIKATAWAVDNSPSTVPDVAKAQPGATLAGGTGGRSWLHVRAQNNAGQWSETAHYPLWLDARPPEGAGVFPASGEKAAPPLMWWDLRDDTGVQPQSIALSVAGKEFSIKDGALRYDMARGRLEWNPLQAIQNGTLAPLENGAKVEWKLAGVRDWAGWTAPERSGSWTFDYALDKIAPVARVSSSTHASAQWESFEPSVSAPLLGSMGAGTVGADSRAEAVLAPEAGSGAGNHALRVTATAAASSAAVTLREGVWDATKTPLVSFRYKFPQNSNLSLRLRLVDGRAWHLRLKGEATDTFGAAPGIEADGQWRWIQFDALPLIKRITNADPAQIKGIDIVDPMKRTAKDFAYEIDDFMLSAPATGAAKLSYLAADLAGVTSYRVAWDQNPNTQPTEETSALERTGEGAAGTYFLHVQAQDRAGNLGPVTHFPVVIR
jgi:hypothetical protein